MAEGEAAGGMRTWTIEDGPTPESPIHVYGSPLPRKPVKVVELEPILRLFEDVMAVTMEGLEHGVGLTVEEREVAALMKAHGRFGRAR